ncbi:MAG: chitobiase/beta-hexosaminidase C-terminal domain-containing protein, partial [Candidatus Marinimicrobia bacterium]|nr:chitobiase/beta-hexosaminidase C-terminal domain-containing protein [Candidatus Neomarinimicrobiota bacterium]
MKQLLIIVFCSWIGAQSVQFNEIMSSNGATIYDEDGDTPDWIELYNSGDNNINLNGHGITDDPSDPFKWVFPNIEISPQDYILLFASEKDRREWVPHWETIIDWGDNWHYLLGNHEPPNNWNQQNFNDAGWLNGPSGFGYGDEDDATVVNPVMSLYVRHEFNVNNFESILKILLHVDYDDAFVAYINGEEIARANIGTPGVPPPYNQGADSWREAEMYQGGAPDEYMIDSVQSLLQNGSNVIAIQVHNFNIESSDLTLIPFLTLGLTNPPDNADGMSEYLDISNVLLHTNFKITASGETLMLSNSGGTVMDSIYTGVMLSDISRGRQPDGDPSWLFFGEPTPESANITTGFLGVLEPPTVSQAGGPFSSPGYIAIESNIPDAVLYYTLDGSYPNIQATLYTDPIYAASNTVIRAVATKPGWLNSKPITHSYLFDYDGILPIISLSTDPEHFWDNDSGIYVMGPNASTDFPYFGANFWQDWERPIHIELFEPNGELGFSIDGGVKIYGNYSRANPQKSLSIFARGMYGYPEINYQVFPDKNIDQFEAIVLRNSGNDWNT